MKIFPYIFILLIIHIFVGNLSIYSQKQPIGDSFLAAIQKDQYSEAYDYFDQVVKEKISADELEATWKSITDINGSFEQYNFNCSEYTDPYSVLYFSCKFERQTIDLKLVFDDQDSIVGFFYVPVHHCNSQSAYSTPAYASPPSMEEEDIQINSDSLTLHASIVLPKDEFQAICILVQGSGPQDRDESIGPNKPFKDLALGLASNGIGTIRYDKRYFTYRSINEDITIRSEAVDDVLAIIDYVKEKESLNSKPIFIIGHSLGGMLAPYIASLSSDVQGITMMAANAYSLEEIVLSQYKYLFNLDNSISPKEEEALAELDRQITYLKDSLSESSSPKELPLNLPPAYWISLIDYDQVETAKKLTIPMLILQGKRDYQVNMDNYELWKKSLEGKENVSFKVYDQLNHLFLAGEGVPTPNEYEEIGNIPDYVIKDITNWIKQMD